METKTISQEILDFLKRHKKTVWFGGELERRLSTHHKPSSINRVLRMLAEDGLIEKMFERVEGVSREVVKYQAK